MINRLALNGLFACAATLLPALTAHADVGMPTGNFNIRIRHGAYELNTGVTVPADMSIYDGDPEDHVQIGTINNDPLILKLVADGSPEFRIVHFFISLPASIDNVYESGGSSIFNPLDPSPITVDVSGLSFLNTTAVIPTVPNNPSFLTAYMRDTAPNAAGRFYNLPGGTYIAPGVLGPDPQIQVGGNLFNDADTSQYHYTMLSYMNPSASWRWGNIPNPMTSNVATMNGLAPSDGRVFELGLSVGFVGVPEPGTLGLLVPGMMMILFARKRR